MNSYTLSRLWFAFAFENPSKVKPIHGSIYFWIIELANRLGWPAEFGNPGSQCMAACGIASYNTYKKAFDDLVEFGFIDVKRKSINQYSSCIIALVISDKPQYKALDKALANHGTKHLQSTEQSTSESSDSINKPLNPEPTNLEPLNSSPELFKEENSEGLKAKPEKPKEKSSAKKEKVRPWKDDLQMPYPSEAFAAKWEEYNEYREARKPKIPFSTQATEQRLLNKLSQFNEDFAIAQIDRAMEGNWQGLVFQETGNDFKKFLASQKNEQPTNLQQQSNTGPSNAVRLAWAIAS